MMYIEYAVLPDLYTSDLQLHNVPHLPDSKQNRQMWLRLGKNQSHWFAQSLIFFWNLRWHTEPLPCLNLKMTFKCRIIYIDIFFASQIFMRL